MKENLGRACSYRGKTVNLNQFQVYGSFEGLVIMKSITIHNLDDATESLIQKKAKDEGLSLNKVIKKLLKQALGLDSEAKIENHKQFRDLCGVWSQRDLVEFDKLTKDLEEVDLRDWQ